MSSARIRGAITALVLSAVAAIVLTPDSTPAQTWGLGGNHPTAVGESRAVGFAEATMPLQMEVTLTLRNRAQLEELLGEQQDPSSPNYHKWLTSDEFKRRFGPTEDEMRVVSKWLMSSGFTVISSDIEARSIRFNGTVADVERGFNTKILRFGDGSSYGNATDPQIPTQILDLIGAIEGLDNMHRAVPGSRLSSPSGPVGRPEINLKLLKLAANLDLSESLPQENFDSPSVAPSGYFAPRDFYTFYDQNPLLKGGVNGSGGQCVAIIGESDFLTAAVSKFNSIFGLPDNSASITKVFPLGNPGLNFNGAEFEALLDVEWSHAVAPGAAQVFYATQDLTTAISRAVNDNTCSVISISFQFCGSSSTFFTGTLDPIFAKAASQGQTVFIASGDNGAAGLVFNANTNSCVVANSRHVNEAAADPNVTGVGGTQFVPNYDGSDNDVGFVPESVWNDGNGGFGASGGGASAIFAKPTYQTGVGDSVRDVPDVASIGGSPFVFVEGDSNGVPINTAAEGTSVATPLWAGINRLGFQIGGRQGNINSRIYKLGAAGNGGFRDVTSGNNTFRGVAGFAAGFGYDQATGWGTVDISRFVNAFLGLNAHFTNVPGSASDIGVGADGSVWVVNSAGLIYRYNGTSFQSIPGQARRVAVDPNGNAWVINSGGLIYRYTGSGFVNVPGLASDVGIGANGTVWVTNPTGLIYRCNGSSFQPIPGQASRIAVDPNGNAWVVNPAGLVYRYTGSSFVNVPGSASDIGVGADGVVWITNAAGRIYRYNGVNFVQVAGMASQISVDPVGQAWVVNGGGLIYRANGFPY